MGIFDSSTLASALSRVGQAGQGYYEQRDKRAALQKEAGDDALRRQILQGQASDRARTEAERVARAIAFRNYAQGDPNMTPEFLSVLQASPDYQDNYMTARNAPPRAQPQPGQDDLEGMILEHVAGGTNFSQALQKAIKVSPKELHPGLRAAAERLRARRAGEGRAVAGAEQRDVRFEERGPGGELSVSGQRTADRAGAAGLAARYFQNLPPGQTLGRAQSDVVMQGVQREYPQLPPNEVAQVVLAEMAKALDEARQRSVGASARANPIVNPWPTKPTPAATPSPVAAPAPVARRRAPPGVGG